MTLKQRAKKLKADIPVVLLAFRKKETPLLSKLLLVFVMVYALSPIDLIPDFIPILGYLDDVILLPALIALAIHFIPEEVMVSCRAEVKNQNTFYEKKWYFAMPFVLIWLLVGWLIYQTIIG